MRRGGARFLLCGGSISVQFSEEVRDRQTCVGCGKKSPETETNYTLISAQFGWRLTRFHGPDGALVVQWRCPNCWRDFKRSRTGAGAAGGAGGGSPSPPPEAPLRTPVRPPVGRPMTPFESLRVPNSEDSSVSSVRRPPAPIVSPPPSAPAPDTASSRPPSSKPHSSKPGRGGPAPA
jgi:hypothetical protein